MYKSVMLKKKKNENKFLKDKKYRKTRDHCHYTGEYRGAADSICNLKYRVPKTIPIVFHSWSNYDYHFIIKKLVQDFKKNIICLGEDAENIWVYHQKKWDCYWLLFNNDIRK